MKLTRIKLSKAAEITSSKRIYMSDYTNYGIPFYRSKEIINLFNNSKIQDILYISKQKYEVIKSRFGVPQKGDILFTSVGTIGIPYLIRDNEKFYFKDGNLTWFRKFSSEVKPEFLFYLFQSPSIKKRIINYSKGSSQSAITIETLKEIELDFPPIEYQKKITDILSSYGDLIDINRRRIQLLEEAVRLLFREWFVYFRFPGHEKVKMVDGVPEGWERGLLGNIAVIKKGKNITFEQAVEGDIPVVGGGLEPTYYHNKANVSAPVITISASGANAGYVNVYNTDIWASDCSYVDKNSTKYIFSLYSRLKSLQAAILGFQVGVAQPHVYPRDLNRLKLLMAPDDLCVKFEQLVIPIFNLIKNLKLENQKLAQARDLLLPRLMSGEIEV